MASVANTFVANFKHATNTMSRLPPLSIDRLTPEQEKLYQEIMRTRSKGLDGPFGVWLRKPSVGEPCEKLQNAFRLNGTLDRRVAELLILVVAREWTAQYAWQLHEQLALKAGLAPATIDAIRNRQKPTTLLEDEKSVYDVASELITTRRVSRSTFDSALSALGEDKLIEVVSAVGFYTMVCMTLNAFEVPNVEGAAPLI